MNTKDKIIQKALMLFNDRGYTVVTTRHIAQELEISPGNLHYHFKHSEEIVSVLLTDLIYQTEFLMNSFKSGSGISIPNLQHYLRSVLELFFDYRFIFINFNDVFRDVPELKSKFLEVYSKRKKQFEEIIREFQQMKIFREDLPSELIESVIAQIFIIADNYISYNRMINEFERSEAVRYYSQIIMNLFLPLFVEKDRTYYLQNYLSY
ncbi:MULTISPECIES: TetR/AcrR family transcriptional regulator [Chryseobacterium]|uniref:AcrR family transcriptional regulator n=1 Tax=Chryseobacterium camelliae TaxID=1265445 RepID=A0ABU0TIS7_9FLAO|nr:MULTISPECIES: TetR/AcrR family transcriptional regulator [Chryseobacterium]MDT3409184.1 AcrR family transcriptional regulator [Pseudacidovorax intermedius]MDQ1096955.1 AcrR family transcriptional regulator [Chryseobacterium camelliae]MDQ1100896.1 AcrR family transcriptional regulator [Chryseobacterium sp. SORGH_AS_1048]MDR6084339.1 AcrR family transcriptional regulator [Chryseobacterium sp. SORGH_AS_0909]MDR6132610.1 AcrR family transcriptional regulator [Chryseobacterium sp. SORGH_AS_1175]